MCFIDCWDSVLEKMFESDKRVSWTCDIYTFEFVEIRLRLLWFIHTWNQTKKQTVFCNVFNSNGECNVIEPRHVNLVFVVNTKCPTNSCFQQWLFKHNQIHTYLETNFGTTNFKTQTIVSHRKEKESVRHKFKLEKNFRSLDEYTYWCRI